MSYDRPKVETRVEPNTLMKQVSCTENVLFTSTNII